VYRRCLIALVLAILFAGWRAAPALEPQTEQTAYDNLPDPRLVTILNGIASKAGRSDVFPQDGRYVYDLVLKNKLTSGLEIGTANGYAAIWVGMAFGQTRGRLVAIEASKEQGREALARLEQAEQLDHVDLLLDDPFKVIPMLTGPYDFVFLDGKKQDYEKCLTLLLPRVRPGGFIVAHNVTDQSRELAGFIRKITGDPQLKTELVSISSAGMSVTQKRAGSRQ
jgi:predicted O-methyltransferase YrrM